MGIAENVRSELVRKGFTKEEIDLRLHNRAQFLWLFPLIFISGLILLIISSALLFADVTPDWNVTGPLLFAAAVTFFFCVKKIRSMQSAENAFKSRRQGKPIIAEKELAPILPSENLTSKALPKQTSASSTIGIVAVGLGVASLVMPYFAAVLFVPAAFICAVVALSQGDKLKGSVALGLAAIGLFHVINVSNKIDDIDKNLQKEIRTMNENADKAQQVLENTLRNIK